MSFLPQALFGRLPKNHIGFVFCFHNSLKQWRFRVLKVWFRVFWGFGSGGFLVFWGLAPTWYLEGLGFSV